MMEKEKQIEELAEILRKVCDATPNGKCMSKLCRVCRAETVIEAGYRKQSEWISIAERLPEKSGRYLVYGSFAGMPLICGAHYDRYNGFGDDGFTHWMPLPEPPVTKGA